VKALEHQIFKLLSKAAETMRLETYVVGGFVRDLILQRDNKDVDVVVIGSGIEYAQKFYELLPPNEAHIAYFKNFGTAQIKYRDWIIEIIGARKESYRRDSRKPIVEDGTLEDDQNRRDFTINSLYMSLNERNYGELYDPFNGVQDLQDGIIKTPTDPDTTFSDDPLRMLRAIRFAARLNFEIEQQTWDSICRNAYRLEIVSQERITDEFNGMIMGKKPSVAFDLLLKSGLLEQFFPEFVKLLGIETVDGKSHKDNFYHTTQVLDQICELTDNLWLRWAAILHDIAKPQTKRFDPEVGWTFHGHEDRGSRMVKGIFKRLKLPLDEKMKYVEKLVAMHLRPIVLSKEIVTDSAVRRLIVEAGDDVGDLLLLCQADITSKNKFKVAKHIENLKLVGEKIQEVLEKDELRNWQPVITGNHILQRYNIVDPKHIGEIKNHVREAILDGIIPNELESALKIADEFALSMNIQLK
jgi:putative nucleotidyltransferase with HDIG domain